MKIFRIASVEMDVANLKDTIRGIKDDIRDLKKDVKENTNKVKKIDDILEKLNIGLRRVTQPQTTFTELQRKVEKMEVVMSEWKNFKKEMDTATRMDVEKTTKGQVKASSFKIYKIAKNDGIYNIVLITEADGLASEKVLKDIRGNAIEIRADSSEQARNKAMSQYSKLGEWENGTTRTIVARLDKGKVQEIKKYREDKAIDREEKIQNAWWNKD